MFVCIRDSHSFCSVFICRLLARFVDGMKFNIEFTVNRLTVRVQHRAAEMATTCRLGEVLFPAAPLSSQQTELPQLRLDMHTYRPCISLF